ncbi:unnamed protein product [Sphagnum jensenii]|uniref:Uncharacterized protein n=1 Tax=Sphagnum jensenii TaxID=128206 RepID=A0ABP1BK50_9BRYO
MASYGFLSRPDHVLSFTIVIAIARGGRVRSSQEPCMPPKLAIAMITRNELKRIQVGASMNAPNAPTLAEMEMKT